MQVKYFFIIKLLLLLLKIIIILKYYYRFSHNKLNKEQKLKFFKDNEKFLYDSINKGKKIIIENDFIEYLNNNNKFYLIDNKKNNNLGIYNLMYNHIYWKALQSYKINENNVINNNINLINNNNNFNVNNFNENNLINQNQIYNNNNMYNNNKNDNNIIISQITNNLPINEKNQM